MPKATNKQAHKDPKDRAHMWERPARVDEVPVDPVEATDFPHELPRHLHKPNGQYLHVETVQEFHAARADGWSLLPPKPATAKKDDAPAEAEKPAAKPFWPPSFGR